ncbi:MAG: hypothetical protein ABSB86_14415 [Bryobacteraceae bacterium]|jgi:hypothetical protein
MRHRNWAQRVADTSAEPALTVPLAGTNQWYTNPENTPAYPMHNPKLWATIAIGETAVQYYDLLWLQSFTEPVEAKTKAETNLVLKMLVPGPTGYMILNSVN